MENKTMKLAHKKEERKYRDGDECWKWMDSGISLMMRDG